MAELRIAPIVRSQLRDVVEVHARAFPSAAITAFGAEAIRRYYSWLLEGPHDAVLVGAWRGERLVGFCAAGVFRGAMNGFLRKNRAYLALRVATHPRLLASELLRDRIRTALRITFRFSRLARPVAGPERFGVLSIATDPDARGSGAGHALMSEAENRARDRGHTQMTLTVHPDNAEAIRFYERRGWIRNPQQVPWAGAMLREL